MECDPAPREGPFRDVRARAGRCSGAAGGNPPPAETAAWFLAQGPAFHERWMSVALAEARAAAEEGEVPMGCVVVRHLPDGSALPVGRAHNVVEARGDPTAHAERLAIAQAASAIGDWRLTDCALYVTKEPCPMCGGAAVLGRLSLVAWAASDPRRGAHTVFGLFSHPGLNHHPAVLPGCGPAAALAELQGFFRGLRQSGTRHPDAGDRILPNGGTLGFPDVP